MAQATTVPDVSKMGRKRLEALIMWNEGGHGFGIPAFGNMLAWKANPNELKSVVAVCAPKESYTVDELRKLARFSLERTKTYRDTWGTTQGAILIIFDKEVWGDRTRWLRKVMTWERGPMHSDTLDEAIAYMSNLR